jgi:hypothetical protein
MQPQTLKRQRSPSPSPTPTVLQPTPPTVFQSAQHQNPSFQTQIFSPNKKTRVTPQANASQSPLTSINPYVGQPQARLPAPYNSPQQSAFSAYPSHFIAALQQQQPQQQKLGSSMPSYVLPPRHQVGIPSQIDASQKLMLQTILAQNGGLPQNGGIIAGFPLQRPPLPPQHQHPQQPPF